MKITPTWVASFETNVQTLIQDAWQRMSGHLIWDKFMDVKQSATLNEFYFWLIETAKISAEGTGGNKRFDDLAAASYEITNSRYGAGLRLTKDEIEDNVMAQLKGMPALDYAANWAKQIGGHAGYWPQDLLFQLILAGKTSNSFDGVPFFSTSHPINPYNTGSGNYSNLISAKPIDETNASTLNTAVQNFASACATVMSLTQPNGKPRNLKVKYAMSGPSLQKRLFEILDTKYFGTGQGSTENVVSRYGIEPVIASELSTDTAGAYYLAVEEIAGEGGAFVFQDRLPYALTSYQPETNAQLQRNKTFEWSFDGRNAGAYGLPYLFFRVEAT